ncbi:PIG-L deacetylase family protein [Micromonospora sp. LOL_025]|uniref:PIG-L deacetylase family protein n=1 Tax=Micromonospora sp. LOL_025 TaxID=3345413 RepID=UPI003A8C7ED9
MSFPASAPVLSDVVRTLAVFAHPDDVDFGCAGTIATWVDEGVDVSYLLVTRGDSGECGDTPRAEVGRLREEEQRAAAAAAIRRFRPDRVLTSSPLRRWEQLVGPGRPDHLAVGEATTCAVYPDARNRFAHPGLLAAGLEPWVVREIWYAGGPAPDHVVDVTDRYARKVAAMAAHRSQTGRMDVATWVRDQLTATADAAGLPAGRMAEAFAVLRTG